MILDVLQFWYSSTDQIIKFFLLKLFLVHVNLSFCLLPSPYIPGECITLRPSKILHNLSFFFLFPIFHPRMVYSVWISCFYQTTNFYIQIRKINVKNTWKELSFRIDIRGNLFIHRWYNITILIMTLYFSISYFKIRY